MFYNGAYCDIYIGKGAGKKLLNDIQNARRSIKIVSPYLSPFLISELIQLNKRNLDIQLITSDNIEDYEGLYRKNIHKLILQNRETDEVALEKREKWITLSRILTYINWGNLIVLLGLAYLFKDILVAFGLIPIVIISLIINLYKNKIRSKRIYSYWYSQLFPFKVYMSKNQGYEDSMFIHSKIYLIDNQIAYLGSLNFTSSGTKYNYETRIRTTQLDVIQEIEKEFYYLFNHSNLPQRNIEHWGRELYPEPIN